MYPHFSFQSNSIPIPPGRILYDNPCRVCYDYSSGKHYGVFACDGCAGFFKRSVRRNRQYLCKSVGGCFIDRTNRNQCRACRLRKCVQVGMIDEFVQDERGPRKSTHQHQQLYSSSTTTTTLSHHNNQDSSLEIIDDISPSQSVSTGHPTPSPSSSGSITPPVDTSVIILTTSSDSPTNSPSSMQPHYHQQQPSHIHRPQIIDHSKFVERMSLPKCSGPFLCAPKPKYANPDVPIIIPQPLIPNLETICESASRLLFMNVRWAKSVPAFTNLPSSHQIILLDETWRELFVLAATQFDLPIEAGTLMTALGLTSVSSDRQKNLLSEIKIFQETVAMFHQMNVDATEYACLRAIILFKTSAGLRAFPSSINLQDEAQLTLSRYVSTTYTTQQLRFGRLLLLLPALRAIAASTIEELFFRKMIGNTPIERIISDMYKLGDL